MEIGNKIRCIRQMKGLKQQDVAQVLSVSQQTYSRLENNQAKPAYEHIKLLTSMFDISMEDLDKWDGNFVLSGCRNLANNQFNHSLVVIEGEKNFWQQLIEQKEQENQLLIGEIVHLKMLFHMLLNRVTFL
jgi:transcriptional regulator with XRE-family HTH domain